MPTSPPFGAALETLEGPVLAYCRTGTRSATLWALGVASKLSVDAILKTTARAGYDLNSLRSRLDRQHGAVGTPPIPSRHDVVIVGGGAAGLATAASLLRRRQGLDIVVVEPREMHYYQPGWTLVGGGVFDRRQTQRPMADVMPTGVRWVRAAVAGFRPDLQRGHPRRRRDDRLQGLVAAPGIALDWSAIDGLEATLGRNGVTSNYLFDMAPYTWELVRACAKASRCSPSRQCRSNAPARRRRRCISPADHWCRTGRLGDIDVRFDNAGPALFGVQGLCAGADGLCRNATASKLDLQLNLVAIDGDGKACERSVAAKARSRSNFDMIHVCPPQKARRRSSRKARSPRPWLHRRRSANAPPRPLRQCLWAGRRVHAPNAKTAAAARKQAPVVAVNVLRDTRRATSPARSMTAMGPARSPSSAARSCWRSSAITACSSRASPIG